MRGERLAPEALGEGVASSHVGGYLHRKVHASLLQDGHWHTPVHAPKQQGEWDMHAMLEVLPFI